MCAVPVRAHREPSYWPPPVAVLIRHTGYIKCPSGPEWFRQAGQEPDHHDRHRGLAVDAHQPDLLHPERRHPDFPPAAAEEHRRGAGPHHGGRGRPGPPLRSGVRQRGSAPGAVGLQRAGQRAHGPAGAGARRSGAPLHGGPVPAAEHLRDGGQGEGGGRGGLHPGQQRRSGGRPEAAGLSRRASGEDAAGQLSRAVLGETFFKL